MRKNTKKSEEKTPRLIEGSKTWFSLDTPPKLWTPVLMTDGVDIDSGVFSNAGFEHWSPKDFTAKNWKGTKAWMPIPAIDFTVKSEEN